jgi:FKBP-type peptidyl-prolyl cis-trans isomerase FklB
MMGGSLKLNLLTAVLGTILIAAPAAAGKQPALKTEKDRVNYSIGVNFIGNIKHQGVEIDLDLVMKGMQDAYSGEKLLLSDEDIRIGIDTYQRAVKQKHAQMTAKTAEENKKAGEAFLAENKKKEGVVTLPSGLQYKVPRLWRRKATDRTRWNATKGSARQRRRVRQLRPHGNRRPSRSAGSSRDGQKP